jgi:hypothetical protein
MHSRISRFLILVLAISILSACSDSTSKEGVTYTAVTPSLQKTLPAAFDLNGTGSNVDSVAFWEADDPQTSLMFISGKKNSLVEVWQYPFSGNERPFLQHDTFGSSQVNGVAVDQETDQLYVSVAHPANTVAVFSLPTLQFERSFVDNQISLGKEPGIGLYHQDRADTLAYVTSDAGQTVNVYKAEAGEQTNVVGLDHELEMVLADEYHDIIYIPDETGQRGILTYDPDLAPLFRNGQNSFGAGIFQKDAEGIILYACQDNGVDNGHGFLVVSDQRQPETDFEFFDRQSWQHLGTLRLSGVGNTDGLGSIQIPLPDYRLGLFTAINDDASVAGIGWDQILEAMGLSCQ